MNISPRFGTIYKYHDTAEFKAKKAELKAAKIDYAAVTKSSDGMLTVVTHFIYTDENGTKDLTEFRNRLK